MTTSQSYDLLNRLTNIVSASASATFSSAYHYNAANQRTSVTNADGTYWAYTYDDLGQVISGKKRWSAGSLVAGQQFEYGFDDIGNREFSKAGGDQNGANLRTTPYQANLLNQHDLRLVPSQVSVIGEADADATVTVNLSDTVRKGEYWWGEAVAANSAGPAWLAITNIAVLEDGTNPHIVATNVGHTGVARSTESFIYDDDGNLTSDSLWTNTWNAENRRTVVQSSAAVPAAGRAREQWTFLPDGRWTQRVVSTNSGSAWVAMETNRYVWDGQVLLAVLDGTSLLKQTFVRGLDLSGQTGAAPNGAGGVGGLLWMRQGPAPQFACYDGNGNVTGLVRGSDGVETARYEYGPFGEVIRMTGPMAKVNPIRYSTQYADDVTGDLKYLYRDYRADLGRWPNRDPIAEKGGRNLYGFVYNDAVNKIDPKGRAVWWDCVACGAALAGKFGGGVAGCAYGCWEVKSPSYPYGQCMDECLSKHFSPCELWKQFKGNPAEWIGAAACISCGVRTIKDISKGKPPGCDECPKPYHPDPPIPEDPWQKDFVECLAAAVAEWEATHPGTPPDFDWVMNRAKDCMIDKGHPPDHIPTG